MKKIYLIIIFFLNFLFTETVMFPKYQKLFKWTNGVVRYEGVIKSELSKKKLYFQIKNSIVTLFTSYKTLIEIDDREMGMIAGKGNMQAWSTGMWNSKSVAGIWHFTFKIYVKEKKYKYIITSFTHEGVEKKTIFGTKPTSSGGPFFGNKTTSYGSIEMVTGRSSNTKKLLEHAARELKTLEEIFMTLAKNKITNESDF